MYSILKSQISSRQYDLEDMLNRIKKMYAWGSLTEDQADALMVMAREKADPVNSYAPIQERIDSLEKMVANILDRLDKVELQDTPNADDEQSDTPQDEYPAYVQPTGAHDAYRYGDKITFEGKHYTCVVPEGRVCVWTPAVMPACWEEVQ